MEKVAYFKCLCKVEHRILANQLKLDGYEIRLTDKNPEYRKKAQAYGYPMPFIVENGAVFDAISGEVR